MSVSSCNTSDDCSDGPGGGAVAFTPSPPIGNKKGRFRPVEQIDEGFGKVEGDKAVFEPDELFYIACRTKGVLEPYEEFRCKPLEEFIEQDTVLARELAVQRMANYDMIRARKMAIVLKERERLIHSEMSPHKTSSSSTRRPATVPSLKPPSIKVSADQTDLFERVKCRAREAQQRAVHSKRIKEFLTHRKHEEGKRQEAAYKEVKIRHLLSTVQRREIEKLNEKILAQRSIQMEADRKSRNVIKTQWEKTSNALNQTQEKKAESFESSKTSMEQSRAQWIRERALKRETKLARAKHVKQAAENERMAALDAKLEFRKEISKRKGALDCQRADSLKYRRVLQEAYSAQVLSKGKQLEEVRANEIADCHMKKCEKAIVMQQGGNVAKWKTEAKTAANCTRRGKVQRFRAQRDAMEVERLQKKVQDKQRQIEKAGGNRERLLTLRAENLKLTSERKKAMASRLYNEQEILQNKMFTSVNHKHELSARRLQQLGQLRETLEHNPEALSYEVMLSSLGS
eukprot:TRINITY_DN24411_c0_g1_i1.p1 TRINITY_DN24411_c0_g1~~TRINITY_DN24411_c0_g1_i1.p1  ORF type:complete len:515 (+),score=129.32 TRINITY_DN24411_c0_g1_i1:46-1590(+)